MQDMEEDRRCYLCGRAVGLECHHVMSGTANRRLSEVYGLKVWLCHGCHTGPDGVHYNAAKGKQLKQAAQRAFQSYYGHRVWMQLFRKNYLGGNENEPGITEVPDMEVP